MFLLPSGAMTGVRAMWHDLAPPTLMPQLIAYTLARKAAPYVSMTGPDLLVAYWKAVPREVAVSLQVALGSTRRPYRIDEDVLAFQNGDFAPVRPGQPTLLLVDSLLTGNSATALVAALRRMESSPLVVAALVDGRRECGASIQTFAASVPVVACLNQTLVATPNQQQILQPLSPGGALERPIVETPKHRIPPTTFATWLGASIPPALYVGHIDRGSKRHFTTYMNVEKVVREHMQEVIEKYILAAQDFAVDHGGIGTATTVKVVYPDESGFARAIATEFAAGLNSRVGANVEVVRAARVDVNTWQLHAAAWRTGFIGFVVDWGAVTTSTLRILACELAARGARSVHAIVLTSQLDAEARNAAEAVAALRPAPKPFSASLLDDGSNSESLEVKAVPVRFEFLTEAHMGMYSSTECPLCRVARRLRRDAVHAPSRLLREHALRKYEMLRPRSRDEIFEFPATDVLGSELSGSEAVEIWQFRQDLASAHMSTRERARVADDMLNDDLSRRGETWKARIRLLTAETYWLKWPPLNQFEVRQKLATICLSILSRAAGTEAFTVGLRCQAAFILRAASKGLYLDRFGEEVVRAANESSDVAAELCYGIYTLLEAPHHRDSRVLTNVLAALQYAIESTMPHMQSGPAGDSLRSALRALYAQALAQQTELTRGNDILSAWYSLQNGYVAAMNTHAGALTSMLVVLNALSGPSAAVRARGAEKYPAEYWLRIADAWEECRLFLGAQVFPFIERLRDPLDVLLHGRSQASGWSHIFQLDGARATTFSEDLQQLILNPNAFDEPTRARLEHEAFVWFDELLSGPEGRARSGGSRLLRLLHGTPSELSSAWREALARMSQSGAAIHSVEEEINKSVLVFCPRSLLIDALAQLIENACKHRSPEASGHGPSLSIRLALSAARAELIVRNDGSVEAEYPGAGLASYREKLQTFGGDLMHRALQDGDWSYEVVVRLLVWRGETYT
jgi:hypothetical protein